MTPNVRIFASEQAATDADNRLDSYGFSDRTLLLPSKVAGRETQAVDEAIDAGTLPAIYRRLCARSLEEGRGVLAVRTPFGAGESAVLLMEEGETVYTDLMRRYRTGDAAPLSQALGLATLVPFQSSTSLISSKWFLSERLGFGLLSGKAAPLSSLIGFKPVLQRKKNWRYSFGFPMLSRSAAPLSSLFALPVLSKPKGKDEWRSSFGFPLLTRSAAPLSNLFGLEVLYRQRSQTKK